MSLGNIYCLLPNTDRQTALEQAIACYQAALRYFTRENAAEDWAITQNSLGNVYAFLPYGNRYDNLLQAILCYRAALQVNTAQTHPRNSADTLYSLGNAYRGLSSESRDKREIATSLREAIDCYKSALKFYTREETPLEWANVQRGLGLTFTLLP